MVLILMLIMMLKFCVKESNLIGVENFGAAEFLITAGLVLPLSVRK